MYNTQTSNLAEHGLHPHYQHLVANLPQLLGPALILLLASAYPFNIRIVKSILNNNRLASAATGTLFLSIIPHQEPRFLLPTVPLILTSITVPASKLWSRVFWTTWIIFNVVLGVLMGIYHQGGIISAQLAMPSIITSSLNTFHSDAHNVEVFWWKTYPPPSFLLGPEPVHPTTNRSLNISTVPLMGYPQSELVFMLMQHMPTCDPSLIERFFIHKEKTDIYVVAPLAAWRLESTTPEGRAFQYPPVSNFSFAIDMNQPPAQLSLTNLAVFSPHVNLDDMDFGDDGVWPTLERVVGRRGLGVWKVNRICGPVEYLGQHPVVEAPSTSKAEEPTSIGQDQARDTESPEPDQAESDPSTPLAGAPVSTTEPATPEVDPEDEPLHISTTTIPANISAQEINIAT